jgi:hypothetical protein
MCNVLVLEILQFQRTFLSIDSIYAASMHGLSLGETLCTFCPCNFLFIQMAYRFSTILDSEPRDGIKYVYKTISRGIAVHHLEVSHPELEFLKSLWGLGTEEE